MSMSAWLRYHDKQIDDAVRQIEEELGTGGAKDYAEYQKRVGEIRGLKRAGGIVRESLRKYYKEVDEDD